jgi:CHAT domain-containing protein/HEAT repeat protein
MMEDKRIDELIQTLETTTDENTRRQAAYRLGEIAFGNERAISALVRILETSTDENTRWQAAYSLGQIAKGDERAISALVKLLETTTSENTRRRAAISLGQIATGDERAILALVKLLETTTDENTHRRVATSLGKIAKGDERAISELLKLLKTTTDWDTRRQAAGSLGQIATGDERAISELVRILETSTDWYTRSQAADSLGKIAKGDDRAISELVRILETSTDEYIRRQAAASLGKIATGNERAISELVKLLETSTDESTRRRVADSLGKIDPGNERAISALIKLLETSTDWYTRKQAAESLGQIATGDERAISELVRILETSTDESTRRRVAESLGKIATGDERAISALIKLLETSTNEDTRRRAAESLGKIATGDERAISALIKLLETSTNEYTLWRAAESLGKIAKGNDRAIRGGNLSSEILNYCIPIAYSPATTRIAYSPATTPVIEKVVLMRLNLVTDMKKAFKFLIELLFRILNIFLKIRIKKFFKNSFSVDRFFTLIFLSFLKSLTEVYRTLYNLNFIKNNMKKPNKTQKQEVEVNEDNFVCYFATNRPKNIARYFSVNSYQKRKFCYQRILACLDRMQQGRDILTRRSLMQSYLELYQQIVAFSLEFKEYTNTFIYIELFRNRYLVERIAQQDAPLPQTISPALAQQLQTAKQTERQTLQKYTDAISNHSPETELETLGQAWENAKQTLENLYHQVAEIEPEFIAKTKVYPIHFQEVQQILPADTAIIEFFFTETELITLLILPGTESPLIPETLRIKLKPNHLETLARDWVADLEDKNKSKTETIDANIQQLSQRIDRLGELLNFTHLNQYIPRQINHLIILPNNYLHLFPIHALPWNECTENQQRLIDRFSVRYFPNLHIWKICQNRQRTRDSFLGIENPTADKDLIFAKAEIAGICQGYKFINKPEILSGKDAKKTKIMESAKNYHCFHFSGHGEYNFTNPLESYLQLSANHSENLTLSTIFTDLHLPNADLATLSACCTGVVDAFQPTDECLGIATGFLLAGAKAVVSSLWKVNSIATAFLLDEFYRQLDQTSDKAVALQNAQNWLRTRNADELRQRANEWDLSTLESTEVFRLNRALKRLQGRPFENPYFWAAFILTGC